MLLFNVFTAHTHSVQRSRVSSAPVRRLSQGSDNEPKGLIKLDWFKVTKLKQNFQDKNFWRDIFSLSKFVPSLEKFSLVLAMMHA